MVDDDDDGEGDREMFICKRPEVVADAENQKQEQEQHPRSVDSVSLCRCRVAPARGTQAWMVSSLKSLEWISLECQVVYAVLYACRERLIEAGRGIREGTVVVLMTRWTHLVDDLCSILSYPSPPKAPARCTQKYPR